MIIKKNRRNSAIPWYLNPNNKNSMRFKIEKKWRYRNEKKEVQKSSMKQNKQNKTEEKIKKRIYLRYKMV